MSERRIVVTLLPEGREVTTAPGRLLMEVLAEAGIELRHPCGGAGTCGKCRVVFEEGAPEPSADERRTLSLKELQADVRLSCRARLDEDAMVRIPVDSVRARTLQILGAGRVGLRQSAATSLGPPGDPLLRAMPVVMTPPSLQDNTPDVRRLHDAIGCLVRIPPTLLRRLGRTLEDLGYQGSAVLLREELLELLPADDSGKSVPLLAAAVDIGTTTLAVELIDALTGAPLAVTTAINPQTRLGDDVLSRIAIASESHENLRQLQSLVIQAIDGLLQQATSQAGVSRGNIFLVTLAGNTTMLHLACGVDPNRLAAIPFTSALGPSAIFPASELQLSLHENARVIALPVIAGFLGADTVAAVVDCGLDDPGDPEVNRPALLVDIGTNGELVLAVADRLLAASTAAGPAFEGARILHGMRARPGAIERVAIGDDGQVLVETIDGLPPIGLCGSALIDTAALLLQTGILLPDGQLLGPDDVPAELTPSIRERVIEHQGRAAFQLAPSDRSATGGPIVLTEKDLRELQLATGAIRAGITLLLRREGLSEEDLQTVLIAGGFGNFIRPASARRIGLISPKIDVARVVFCGNAALAGAREIACSASALDRAERAAARTIHVELASDPDFSDAFAEAMFFPE